MKSVAYIALGSNLGDRLANLREAVRHLRRPAIEIVAVSRCYVTQPLTLGGETPPWYFNAALEVRSSLDPFALLRRLQEIENGLGRLRPAPWAPRTLDLDLLGVGQQIVDSRDLVLPHPRLHVRRFVLAPLAEVAPHWVHPAKGLTVVQLLSALNDPGQVKPVEGLAASWFA